MLLASKDILFDVAHNIQSSGNASTGKGWGFNNAAGLPYGNYNQQGIGNGQTDTITGTQLSVGGNASLTTTQGDIFVTLALAEWAERKGIALEFIEPGRPMQNVSSNASTAAAGAACWTCILPHAKRGPPTDRNWLANYNRRVPHDSLGGLTNARRVPRSTSTADL
ncbi:transposase [Xanthomonas bromi]|uniref:Transposase n=1 Tax=Xanthomonas bromi TaxID=56449 RepID=A0A1C3NNN9_9XANT|nr:transposase [Xanthomonas bromi]